MKKTKKLFALLLALVMALAMGATSLAAEITINGAAEGETYTAYKLFDVTTSGEGDNAAYSYSTQNADLATDLDTNTDVTFTKAAAESTWYITGGLDNETDAKALADYLNNNLDRLVQDGLLSADDATVTVPEGVDSVKINVEDPGYYFVDSTLGSLCILHTASDSVIVNEKNTVPSITKKVKEDSAGSGSEWQDSATIDVIDTVYYQLTVNTGTNTANLGTGIDGNYVIEDVLPAGINYTNNSVVIEGWTLGTDYTVVSPTPENDNTLTITLLSTGKLAGLGQNTDIVINYNATADENLVVDTPHTNTVTLKYKEQSMSDTAIVKTYDIKGDALGNEFTKVAAETDKALEGVKFILSKGADENLCYAQFDENGYLSNWVTSQDEATKLVTDANGHIYAYGLDADTYVLTETDTLPGYNLLADTITVAIDSDGNVTYGSVKNFVALVKNGSFLVRITDMTILIEKEFIYDSGKRPNPTNYYRK